MKTSTRSQHAQTCTLVCDLAERLMRQPVAPYFEDATRAEALRFCAEYDLPAALDAVGNVFVRLNRAPRQRPLVLAAHLDHPGFAVERRLGPGRLVLKFNGRVADAYFRKGARVRLHPGNVPAHLVRRLRGKALRFEFEVQSAPEVAPVFAVWDLEEFALRQGRIHGRACDDLVGCAAVLATLRELQRRRANVNVIGVLSRAEEVGFQGALTIAADGSLPKDALVISLETSKELPGVRMGGGVILRVGDKASIFDSASSRFVEEVAAELARERKGFSFQRALMGGGTCEATAYQEYGYTSAAVCVALGNYHNSGPRARIAAEFVSVQDVSGMVDLLVAAARAMPRFRALTEKLPRRLQGLLKEARQRLVMTYRTPPARVLV
ncbi:MAG: M20/M25/M40 family metallo-hydrolase [Verrucomicrobia bacterium]|nr:M20/M25/M40 family metallo-hydrolase [Verrucomicrobiota bacterium]